MPTSQQLNSLDLGPCRRATNEKENCSLEPSILGWFGSWQTGFSRNQTIQARCSYHAHNIKEPKNGMMRFLEILNIPQGYASEVQLWNGGKHLSISTVEKFLSQVWRVTKQLPSLVDSWPLNLVWLKNTYGTGSFSSWIQVKRVLKLYENNTSSLLDMGNGKYYALEGSILSRVVPFNGFIISYGGKLHLNLTICAWFSQ